MRCAVKKLLLLILLSSSTLAITRAIDFISLYRDNTIAPLNLESFDGVVRSMDFILLYLHVPWCDECKQMNIEFIKSARTLSERKLGLGLFAIDCNENEQIANRLQVQSFPSVVLIIRETPVFYHGQRTSHSLSSWVLQKLTSASQRFEVSFELDQAIKANRMVLVFVGEDNEREFRTFYQLAQIYPDVHLKFMHSRNKIVAHKSGRQAGGPGRYRVLLFRAFDAPVLEFSSDSFTVDSLKAFIDQHKHELVMPFDGEEAVSRLFYEEGCNLIFHSDSYGLEEHRALLSLAIEYRKKDIRFFHSSTLNPFGSYLAEYLEFSGGKEQQVWLICVKADDVIKYKMYNPLSILSITDFLNRFLSGRLNRQNSMISDEDILIELNRRVFIDFDNATHFYFVFHYNRSRCGPQSQCHKLFETFKRLAKVYHFMLEIDFCFLDYDFYNTIKDSNNKSVRNIQIETPFVSLYDHRSKKFIEYHDFAFTKEALKLIIEETAQIPSDIFAYLDSK